jgi:hypothetical protein
MTVIKVRWSVDELANVMTQFDVQRVYRSTASDSGPWTEITTVGTRVALVAGVTSYLFDDVAGSSAYWYCIDYYNTATTAVSDKSDPIGGTIAGYCSIDDIRTEGFAETAVTDAQIVAGIQRSTALIDRITRQWFDQRTRSFLIDSRRGQSLLLGVPIIAITGVSIGDEVVPVSDMWVYNRHLTMGLNNPDDRRNPKLTWKDEFASDGTIRELHRKFYRNNQFVRLAGVFGFTELNPLVAPGETVLGSQVPLSYGETPEMIKLACIMLTLRYMRPLSSSAGEAFAQRLRVVSESTRDQSYTLASLPQADAAYGLTGDPAVDAILSMYAAPISLGGV